MRRTALHLPVSLAAVGVATLLLRATVEASPTSVALGYLLVVLFVAAVADLWTAIATSVASMACFNFFFLPPVGTLTIADPQNWVALIAFLVVSIVASNLSTSARNRAAEAMERRREVGRLFDLSRDILLMTSREEARAAIARAVARRFELAAVSICVTAPGGGWSVHQGGIDTPTIPAADLDRAFAAASGVIEFDARTRSYTGQQTIATDVGPIRLSPIRLGTQAIGLLATAGDLEPGSLDAVAGVVAIALERLQFLEDRRTAELARQRAELSSALLASLSHDLRTPLTAIRAAVANLDSGTLTDDQRREQAHVASGQLARLSRMFDEILDMARIDAGVVQVSKRWTSPSEITDAALAHAAIDLESRDVDVDADDAMVAEVDPRLVSSAVAHILENAARYATGRVALRAWVEPDALRIDVSDEGPGLKRQELERLFEPFYRGELFRQQVPGTGMGLAITKGLLSAQGGQVWAENLLPHGAKFSIRVPAATRRAPVLTA